MAIDRNLDWRQRADEFDANEKRVLLALSHKKWLWRSLDNLESVTGIEYDELTSTLTGLLRKDLVMGSFASWAQTPVFGLVERNSPAYKRRAASGTAR